VLVKITVDQSSRPMSTSEFIEELESGDYGDVEFEDEQLAEQVRAQRICI
jgi:hypothetical protein